MAVVAYCAFLVGVTALILIVWPWFRGKRTNRVWVEVAERFGLTVTQRAGPFKMPKMSGTVDGVDVEVVAYSQGARLGTPNFTSIVTGHQPADSPLRLRRHRQRFMHQGPAALAASARRGEDVEIGDPAFDEAVHVEAEHAVAAFDLLTPEIRECIVKVYDRAYDADFSEDGARAVLKRVQRAPEPMAELIAALVDIGSALASSATGTPDR